MDPKWILKKKHFWRCGSRVGCLLLRKELWACESVRRPAQDHFNQRQYKVKNFLNCLQAPVLLKNRKYVDRNAVAKSLALISMSLCTFTPETSIELILLQEIPAVCAYSLCLRNGKMNLRGSQPDCDFRSEKLPIQTLHQVEFFQCEKPVIKLDYFQAHQRSRPVRHKTRRCIVLRAVSCGSRCPGSWRRAPRASGDSRQKQDQPSAEKLCSKVPDKRVKAPTLSSLGVKTVLLNCKSEVYKSCPSTVRFEMTERQVLTGQTSADVLAVSDKTQIQKKHAMTFTHENLGAWKVPRI